MASYQEHLARQAANRQANGGGPTIHFMNEFLQNDGDVAIIRFPYTSMDDIVYTATHNVAMPGAPFGRRIRCTENADCELCAKGVKVEERVFVKCLVYDTDNNTNTVVLKNTVWDRPAAFADIELKGLMEEYGDLSQTLFKIKRNGSGKATRYNIFPVVNATVYNPAIYKADFTELNSVDAEKVLSKSIEQYRAALNPNAEVKTTNYKKPVEESVQSAPNYAPNNNIGGYANAYNQGVNTNNTPITNGYPNVSAPQVQSEQQTPPAFNQNPPAFNQNVTFNQPTTDARPTTAPSTGKYKF